MDFFKSVFPIDPLPSDPPGLKNSSSDSLQIPSEQEEELEEETSDDSNPKSASTSSTAAGGGAWSFGGLIKTFASRSESVIQTYRRDLEEFGSGLKKETAAIREAATRTVRDLPGSLEAGVSVSQESLEAVGHAFDDFGGSVWRGTAEIISHGKETLLSVDSDGNASDRYSNVGASKRYSRFEVQVLGIQSDPSTFSQEPEDAEDFRMWKLDFLLAGKGEEIENLCYENAVLVGFLAKLVPSVVDRETFWSRYFYRVHKFKEADDARANLVRKVISREEEDDLSWEVEDNSEKVNEETKKETFETSESVEEKKPIEVSEVERMEAAGAMPEGKVPEGVRKVEDNSESNGNNLISKLDDEILKEENMEPGSMSVVSRQPSMNEEDEIGWDEIEDLGEYDEKKVVGSEGSPKRLDLLKRLSAVEEDEDLNWDIEEDEPTKP